MLPADQRKQLEGQLARYYHKGCPFCGTSDWVADNEVVLLRRLVAEHAEFFHSKDSPILSMFCSGCGYLLVFFAADITLV